MFTFPLSRYVQDFRTHLVRSSLGERNAVFAERYGGEPGFTVIDGQHRAASMRQLAERYARHGETVQQMLHRVADRAGIPIPKLDGLVNPCAEIALPQLEHCIFYEGFGVTGSPYNSHLAWTQHRWIAKSVFRKMFDIHLDSVVIELVGLVPLNRKKLKKLADQCTSGFAREVVYAFYNQSKKTNWWSEYRRIARELKDVESVAQFLGEAYYDAVGPGRNEGIPMSYRTSTVVALVRGMFQDEAFDRAPILKDALMDAGYSQEDVLNHLGNCGIRSCGSWIFRTMGLS